jgi:integrase
MTYQGGQTMADSNRTRKPPSYRLHKASGQAVVTLHGKDYYLGPHGSLESRTRYERIVSGWMASPDTPVQIEPDLAGALTVVELAAQYLRWASTYYVKNGEPTTELRNVKRAIRGLRESFANLPARDFSPLKLKQVRQRFIADGLARTNCNRYTGIVVRIFSWATENELIPSSVVHALREVKPLTKGRCEAPEMEPILPVDDGVVEQTCQHLTPMLKAMVQIQRILACRPGELCSLRPCDIDMTRPVWVYTPARHKTEHKSKSRIIPIGPRARLLLTPWLPEFAAQFVWRDPDGKPISAVAYGGAIAYACKRHGIPHWTPNQLRHAGATRIRQQASLDAAQIILGHSTIATTQIYAEKNLDAAMEIAAKIG